MSLCESQAYLFKCHSCKESDYCFKIMDHQEKPEVFPSLPVLSRIDRLDRLVELLEERHYLSARHSLSSVITKVKKEDKCKTLSSALEEVNHKGTLMERLTMLETRVLQLSLELEIGNTSRSSSSTIQMPEKIEDKSGFPAVTRQDENIIDTLQVVQDKKDPLISQENSLVEACEPKSQDSQKDRRRTRVTKKWFGWFRIGC